MQFLRRALFGIALLAMTAGILAFAAITVRSALETRRDAAGGVRPQRERVLAVNVVAFRTQDIAPELTAFGEIRARRTLDVRASTSGTLTRLGAGVEEGGAVARGQLLFQIDPARAETALAVARTDLQDGEVELDDARSALELAHDDLASARAQSDIRERALRRQRDLLARGVGNEASVETAELAAAAAQQSIVSRRQALAQAETRVGQAETRLARAAIALDEAQRDLDDTTITAGFDGVLSDVVATQGGLVAGNERLARLIDPAALEVSFLVSTAQHARLIDENGDLIGLPLTVSLDVGGIAITARGRISRQSAAVAEGQTGRLLFATLDSAAGFRPGDFATVRIVEPPLRSVARLPSSAVDAGPSMLVVDDDDRLAVVAVDLLRRQGDDVLLRAPLADGAWVVAQRSPLLGAGIRVRPVAPPVADGGTPAPAAPAAPETIALAPERRDRLIAFVEANQRMPSDVKTRILNALQGPEVPVQMVERLESRMGG